MNIIYNIISSKKFRSWLASPTSNLHLFFELFTFHSFFSYSKFRVRTFEDKQTEVQAKLVRAYTAQLKTPTCL